MEEDKSELLQTSSLDHLDDLFDYDVGLDDILQEAPSKSNANAPKPSVAPEASGLGLGLDEEVKVSKKRQPVAKLDENRLLSQRGISKLRHAAKAKLKLKGKGHEFSDAARLLNFYQLWLDDLFPRAKFADGLAMIEKLGHSKRLQTMRREWIEEEKPKTQTDNRQNTPESHSVSERPDDAAINDFYNPSFTNVNKNFPPDMDGVLAGESPVFSGEPSEMRRQTGEQNLADQELFMPHKDRDVQQGLEQAMPGDDELDALLNEHESGDPEFHKLPTISEAGLPANGKRFDEDDELEAMNELETLGSVFN